MTLRPLLFVAALGTATPALAVDRVVGVGSYTRLRVDSGIEVRATPGSPRVKISGERDAVEAIDAHVDGATLVLRRSLNSWGERPTATTRAPVVVTLSTPALDNIAVAGTGHVVVARMVGRRIDLSVAGSGAIEVAAAQADQLNAEVVGTGTIAVAGKAATARLTTNGPGTIEAAKLDANDLTVRLDGLGTTTAAARYTATVINVGLGSVTVSGPAKCRVEARAGGPVVCGGRD